jgi:protein involved in polysaccharide export with SLBB domain
MQRAVLLLVAALSGIILLLTAQPPDRKPSEADSTFVIRPLDQLVVIIWRQDPKEVAITRAVPSVLVRPDGRITLPEIGVVLASERTPTQLGRICEELYATQLGMQAVHVSIGVAARYGSSSTPPI